MTLQVKLIFTCVAVAVATAILLIDPKADNAGVSWLWRSGGNDLLRNAMCRTDGSFRKYTRLAILVWFAVILAVLWLVA